MIYVPPELETHPRGAANWEAIMNTTDCPVLRTRYVALALMLVIPLAGATVAFGQPASDPGYDSLPDGGRWLLGAARDLDAYKTLSESQRVTYEAIIHALDHHRLLGILDAVTAIWGKEAVPRNGRTPPAKGTDQFRLSVVLDPNALTRLWESGFEFDGRGHVRFARGSSARVRSTDSARGPQDLPRLHVSWLRADPRVGEIDIDYRSGLPHMDRDNSDVRKSSDGTSHYCLHRAKYGNRLVDWWNEEQEQC